MQLQIQTFKKDLKQSFQQKKPYQITSNKLFLSPKIIIPSHALLSQLRQIQLNAKANYHHLTNLRKKAFKVLTQQDYQAQLIIIEKYFLCFKYYKIESKHEKKQKRRFINNLIQIHELKNIKKDKMNKAIKFYQNKLIRKVFNEIFESIKVNKNEQKLGKRLKIQRGIQFIELLKQALRQRKNKKLQQQQAKQQIDRVYRINTYKKALNSWGLFIKTNRLQKSMKQLYLKRLITKLIDEKTQLIKLIENYRSNQQFKIKQKVFEAFKQTKLQAQCLDWYKYRLQKICYKKWIQYHQIVKQQQQIQQSNQIILKHYIQQKQVINNNKLLHKYWKYWKSFLLLQKQQKKQTQILKSFAQLKQKQYLERKYFNYLVNNKNYQKSIKFYQTNTKSKVIQSFKRNLIFQTKKNMNLFKFVQKRTIGNYFYKIIQFNKNYQNKIYIFKLQNLWFKFTFNITQQYFQKIQKARNYNQISLKFKTIFGLRKNLQINKKAQYCGFYINILLPFKRWHQRFRYRKIIQEKQFYLLKKLFFQWKIITIRRQLSKQNKLKYQTSQSQLFLQSQIQSRPQKYKYQQNKQITNSLNNHSSESQQISFFKKLKQDKLSDQEDQVQKKVDSLLQKIRSQKSYNKLIKPKQNIQGFSNQRLLFANQNLSYNQKSLTIQRGKQTNQRVRLPTWSTPGGQYRVSVFSDDQD